MRNEERSRIMRAVRSKDTAPELFVRRLVHRLGYRFRLHRKDLAGKPDLVFPARSKVIFVHGCFWHGHDCARGRREPATNRDYWLPKIARTKARDARHLTDLAAAGWAALVIWECQLKDAGTITRSVKAFLGKARQR
jgi:DNA mismatch endonuclease (patch repair protein)